jgi:hypothetical protein
MYYNQLSRGLIKNGTGKGIGYFIPLFLATRPSRIRARTWFLFPAFLGGRAIVHATCSRCNATWARAGEDACAIVLPNLSTFAGVRVVHRVDWSACPIPAYCVRSPRARPHVKKNRGRGRCNTNESDRERV